MNPESTNRKNLLGRITNQAQWDLLVIGGGATGLGVALEAISRGYKTLLVEQADFAKGTSSRSTKLVHGGVRYLAQGDVKLVREASIERGLLHRNAPHLVKDQTFIVPVYSFWSRLKYSIGLKLYDRIAGKLSLGHSVFISKEETIKKLPGIKTQGLKGGVLYYDGQFDDSRLAINLAQTIIEQGGVAINYVKVTGLHKNANGTINGASLIDTESGTLLNVNAKALVNATGVFVDDILQMDKPGSAKTICASQGVHVVLSKSFFPSEHALMIPQTSDGRVLFAVPWHNKVVVGTTDTPIKDVVLEPVALDKEIDFILDTAGAYLTKKPTRNDVLSVFAGLRPLAAPQGEQQQTKEISRSHKIIVSPSKLFTMLGGKWTTYRKMGEDMLDSIEKELQWQFTTSGTATMHIHGYSENTNWQHPFYYYGSDEAFLESQVKAAKSDWLSEELHIHPQQVVWAVHYEMARTVEDFLSRRTRALFLDAAESRRIAPDVANIMAIELGESETWKAAQLAAFNQVSEKYLL
ncbi:MAG TPA: glycerol-3-phosphate dehydrogenase/oxidase [Ferruginibacter sp.]|nr:glycerol-3-phosphate dehydrogenase/oxidase [Ferruginibacter sp.]HRE64885.1 glycerol-3-phosphate dehydrogenase/oxidase [Ferruginibacter sp.]